MAYQFDTEKAKHLHEVSFGNAGLYCGELDGTLIVYDLDMGELRLAKDLNRGQLREVEASDYEEWLPNVLNGVTAMGLKLDLIEMEDAIREFLGELEG